MAASRGRSPICPLRALPWHMAQRTELGSCSQGRTALGHTPAGRMGLPAWEKQPQALRAEERHGHNAQFPLKRCLACRSAPRMEAMTALTQRLQPSLPWDGWSVPPRIPTAREAQHGVPLENASYDTEPMWRTERRAFFSEPLWSCGRQAALSSPNCFYFGSWACLEVLEWKSEHLARGALPSDVLMAKAFVLLQSSWGLSKQAKQVGQRQQIKSAGYFLRKKQLKTTRIKQDWETLGYKTGGSLKFSLKQLLR